MKPLLLFCLLIIMQSMSAQSLDYISLRKKGRTLKNFYTGSTILFQTIDGNYLHGPIKAIRNDSVFITVYNIRYLPTTFGTMLKDTISVFVIGLNYKEIKRVELHGRGGFLERIAGPLLMIGGAGYFTLNVLNGALFSLPVTDKRNLKTLGIAGGVFGIGYLLHKLFSSDGFSTKKHSIVYVDL